MMKTFMEISSFRKCRLWVNDFPYPSITQPEKVIEKRISSPVKKSMDKTQLAIEVSLPKNMSNYALIGFEFISDETMDDETTVSVYFTNEQNDYLHEFLAKTNDKAIIGIPEEYTQSILDSATEVLNDLGTYPAGKIVFNIGAHSKCGSSKMVFAQATKVLIMLSQLDLENISNELIQKEIENIL